MWEAYLSHEGRIVAVLEVFREHCLGESFLVDDDEADARGSPSHGFLVLVVLRQNRTTLSNS